MDPLAGRFGRGDLVQIEWEDDEALGLGPNEVVQARTGLIRSEHTRFL